MAVFVSYSSRDRALLDGLLVALRRGREQVWLDEELTGGETWWRTILEQIRAQKLAARAEACRGPSRRRPTSWCALESWSLKIERHLADTRSVWTFANNHFEGFAPETCQRLANRLGFELPLPSPAEIASADPGQLDFFVGKDAS